MYWSPHLKSQPIPHYDHFTPITIASSDSSNPTNLPTPNSPNPSHLTYYAIHQLFFCIYALIHSTLPTSSSMSAHNNPATCDTHPHYYYHHCHGYATPLLILHSPPAITYNHSIVGFHPSIDEDSQS